MDFHAHSKVSFIVTRHRDILWFIENIYHSILTVSDVSMYLHVKARVKLAIAGLSNMLDKPIEFSHSVYILPFPRLHSRMHKTILYV